ncbi:MAG: putative dsRNA-binding protein [Trueperaceae bacterium]|nr:putative dsRNA-binding protein [Trueperaceae bacterium]
MAHPKSSLIDRCKNLGLAKPEFDTRSTGPDHEPTFLSDVIIDGEVYGTGQGGNKRDAERRASEEALDQLARMQQPGTDISLEDADAANGPYSPAPASDGSVGNGASSTFDGPFDGPWPIFPEVLAASLNIANSRTSKRFEGDEAIDAVRSLALKLYKDSLESLGEVVEVDDSLEEHVG